MGAQFDTFEKEPNVYITEAASPAPPPAGIPASTGGFFGVAKWGPVNKAELVQSFDEWVRKFGSYISSTYPSWKQVKKFFDNGGKRMYFVRVVHMTDPTDGSTKASAAAVGKIYDDVPGTAAVVAAAAADAGNTGDDTATSSGTYTGVTGSFRVKVTTAGNWGTGVVTVYFTPQGGAEVTVGTVTPADDTVFDLENGAKLKLADPDTDPDGGLVLNDQWTVAVTAATYASGDERIHAVAKYDGALGNNLTIRVLDATGGVAGEFKLEVYLNSEFKESFDNLSLVTTASNYFVKKTAGSDYVILTDTSNINDIGIGLTTTFSGGNDGLTGLVVADYKGSVNAQTGMRSLSSVPLEEPMLIVCPDADAMANPATMQKDMADFCDDVQTTSFAILAVPDELNPTEVKTYQLTTLAKDSPRAALYHPWVLDEDDDTYISPVGAIAGVYSRFAYDITKGIWWSPAGSEATLRGVKGLRTILNSTNAGVLNEVRVNCLKSLQGIGIVIWGSRTLAIAKAADFKYIGARLNTSDVEARIFKNTKWAPHRPHDSFLYGDISTTVQAILNRRYLDGGLDGTKASEAYGVLCNGDINTQAMKNQGTVACRVGIRNKQTAEFIWFNISQYASGGSITE